MNPTNDKIQEHIIGQNQKLVSEISQLKQRLMSMSEDFKIQVEELGQRENQVTYMRGVLKNLLSIHKCHENISKHLEIKNSKQELLNREVTQYSKEVFQKSILSTVLIGPYIISLFTCETWVRVYFLIIGSLYFWFTASSIMNRRSLAIQNTKQIKQFLVRNDQTVSKSRHELTQTLRDCDLLNNYIDNI